MSKLRTQLDQTKIEYLQNRYPGNLAAELLSMQNQGRKISAHPQPGRSFKLARYLPLISSAVAALFAVAVYQKIHQPGTKPDTKTVVIALPTTSEVKTGILAQRGMEWLKSTEMPSISPSMPDVNINANVQVALVKFNGHLETAMEAPLVSESVDTVKEVALGLREVAATTWSQVWLCH